MSYNGWSNYETWAVKLWLDNEQGSYYAMTEQANELLKEHDTGEDGIFDASIAMADYVKELHEEANPLNGESSVFSDLLGAALSEVNWYEIGEAYVKDAKEENE